MTYAPRGTRTPAESLSPREREVLALLCADYTDKEIAQKLVITVGTVWVHVHHIQEKFGIYGKHTRGAYWRALAGVRDVL